MRLKHELIRSISDNWMSFVLAILLFQLLVDIVIVLDVPVARQILGLIYLTLVPGILLMRLFGLNGFDSVENFLFSIGLSVAFVMFLGLTVNQIGLLLGLVPLTIPILIIAMNGIVLSLCALCNFLRRGIQTNRTRFDLSLTSILFVCFPFLAILGTTLVNSSGSSVILLLMIGFVALTIMVISAVKTRANLAFTIFMITIAVLLQTSLISNYVVGYDVHPAYHVFRITQDRGIWISATNETDPLIPRSNQMLSLTIFPVVYSDILNLDGTWIFKIVYPLLLAFVPVGLYRLYQRHVEKKTAFVAAFFILADITFISEMPGLPAQIIAEFFLTLLLILLFQKDITQSKKISLFAIFSMGVVVSHYGISYIFMFLLFFSWLFLFMGRKKTKIKLTYVILFFVLVFSWYIYTAQSASFDTLLDMGQNVYSSFWTDFFNPESRTGTTLAGVGASAADSLAHWIGRAFHYATQLFIVLGLMGIFLARKTMRGYDYEYILISVSMLGFALAPLIAPSFNLLNVQRTYHLSLLFLAPFCIIGGDMFFSSFFKILKWAHARIQRSIRGPHIFGAFTGAILNRKRLRNHISLILTSIVVVSLFLFESGFFYEVIRDKGTYSASLNADYRKTAYGYGYLSESFDVSGALWLRSAIDFWPLMDEAWDSLSDWSIQGGLVEINPPGELHVAVSGELGGVNRTLAAFPGVLPSTTKRYFENTVYLMNENHTTAFEYEDDTHTIGLLLSSTSYAILNKTLEAKGCPSGLKLWVKWGLEVDPANHSVRVYRDGKLIDERTDIDYLARAGTPNVHIFGDTGAEFRVTHTKLANVHDIRIYGDVVSVIKSPLTSYAALPPDHMQPLSNVTRLHGEDEYVYLRDFNTRYLRTLDATDGNIMGLNPTSGSAAPCNVTYLRSVFQELNRVYDNGGSEIYIGTP